MVAILIDMKDGIISSISQSRDDEFALSSVKTLPQMGCSNQADESRSSFLSRAVKAL
jgi:hypothetical protein